MWQACRKKTQKKTQQTLALDFLGLRKCDKRQILHDGTAYRALTVHTSFTDLDHMSKLQQCQTFLLKS